MTAILDAPASTDVSKGFDHRATAPEGSVGLSIERVYTKPGVHPYDEVDWERRDVVMTNWRDNSVVNFEQRGVEFPTFWSVNAGQIVTSKYFRGEQGTERRENSLKQLIDRVVGQYVKAGREWGYFASDDDAEIFEHELTYMLLHQIFSFNSPVWFNVGAKSLDRETKEWGLVPQQVSACFILSVDDTMDSILNWYREEGLIFKGGSGSGLNLSRIRGSMEQLSIGGRASGPISFMRGADASSGAIKSGGSTRRAAKMVVLDVDHPDIEEFVKIKAHEEGKIRALKDAGYDMDLDGYDMPSVQFQNANNSVRVTDDFMRAVEEGGSFDLISRVSGKTLKTIDAKALFRAMAQAAWECADPGIQYDGTINDWHTNPVTGRISASNPCSEYMSLDNSSCNLASLNLLKFLNEDDTFDSATFVKAVEFVITAMDISICFADFPTQKITDTTHRFRQLGVGYANLGALLMAQGLAYDSDGGRSLAAAITSLMTAVSYRRSAELAGIVGPYEGFAVNVDGHARVMRKHAAANDAIAAHGQNARAIVALAAKEWAAGNEIGGRQGWRNAQASLLAPTGTIGFMMDCDTTGVEPDLALVKYKKLVGGGSMQIVNQQVPRALRALGYDDESIKTIVEHVVGKVDPNDPEKGPQGGRGNVVGAPGLDPAHYEVFDCAMSGKDLRTIQPMGHVLMMAAVQPFLSGAISKTVNLPEEATVEDIEDVYFRGWKLGLKALAVYRDNCKVGQPLSVAKASEASAPVTVVTGPARRKLPKQRNATVRSFRVGGLKGYLTASQFEDGELGEVFIKVAKQGTALAGFLDAFSIDFSMGRQYHVPLEVVLSKYLGMSFEPSGMTDDPDIRMASSVMDYLARRLALDYLPFDVRAELNVYTVEERARKEATGSYLPVDEVEAESSAEPVVTLAAIEASGGGEPTHYPIVGSLDVDQICTTCGTPMQRAGSCYACTNCGSTSGCS